MAELRDTGPSDPLDALRRDLYRPGSTDEQLQRYLEERDATDPELSDGKAPQYALPRRRLLVVGAGTGVGLALVAALIVGSGQKQPVRVAATRSASPTPAATAVVTDVGEGQTLAVRAGAVTSSVTTATSVRGTPVIGRRYEGSGNAVIPLDPPADPRRGGTAMVLIESNSRVPVAWRALSQLQLGRAISEPLVLGRGISAEPSSAPAPQVFVYRAGALPARIAVAASPGTRWSLLFAVADDGSTLR